MTNKLSVRCQSVLMSKPSFFQFCLLAKIKLFFGFKDFGKVINALIKTRIEFCNSLHKGIDDSSLHYLQMVQNAAAQLLEQKHEWAQIPVINIFYLYISFVTL